MYSKSFFVKDIVILQRPEKNEERVRETRGCSATRIVSAHSSLCICLPPSTTSRSELIPTEGLHFDLSPQPPLPHTNAFSTMVREFMASGTRTQRVRASLARLRLVETTARPIKDARGSVSNGAVCLLLWPFAAASLLFRAFFSSYSAGRGEVAQRRRRKREHRHAPAPTMAHALN